MNQPPKEPIFTAPWPAMTLIGLILGLYALQSTFGTDEVLVYWFGLNPAQLSVATSYNLVTSLFLHGNWGHALLNGFFALAFVSGVSRAFGTNAAGATSFFIYYIVCGVAAGLMYCAVYPDRYVYLIGASGAVSGLMGAAIRLGPGYLLPFTNRRVVGMTLAWVLINILSAFVNITPGSGPIAWEAHIFGYAFGLLTIGIWLRLFHKSFFHVNLTF
ncbi:MAG: rhomboid family intramembrane serine protease [Asticcacaulis sp.]